MSGAPGRRSGGSAAHLTSDRGRTASRSSAAGKACVTCRYRAVCATVRCAKGQWPVRARPEGCEAPGRKARAPRSIDEALRRARVFKGEYTAADLEAARHNLARHLHELRWVQFFTTAAFSGAEVHQLPGQVGGVAAL
ncbi:hypothetical protein [Streptomyces sp. NPDC088254]|uniref:hypothetical protein n=1 Tax=Streptomyces sp. NPDC088254 TaxID=3365847 RepID=UPI0038110427